MKKTLNTLALCIVIIIIILPELINLLYVLYDREVEKNVTYRTGDLLLFKCTNTNIIKKSKKLFNIDFSKFFTKDYYENNLLKLYTKKYIHIGIVIVINNHPYIYEISDKSYNKKRYDNYTNKYVYNKPALIDISYLNHYYGDVYKSSYIGPEIETNYLIPIFKKYQNYIISSNDTVINCIKKKMDVINNNKSTSCTEFTAKIIKTLNIVDIDPHPCITGDIILDICIKSGKYLPEVLIHEQLY